MEARKLLKTVFVQLVFFSLYIYHYHIYREL
jgi:hypothetical protein